MSNTTVFDQILPITLDVLSAQRATVDKLEWLLINRDLNSRVRLIVPEAVKTEEGIQNQVKALAKELVEKLGRHSYPAETAILYEARRELACQGSTNYLLEGFRNVWLVDRLATESDWAQIAKEAQEPHRVVFFSIKGGVGRSTALAATAWHLAQAGKRVLVMDLDLESPGLSTSLLREDQQPAYGITDWLLEDLVDNGTEVLDSMVATSALSHDGEIYVVPAHGADPGEYISKLGRVWMPKVCGGRRESWSQRLQRLIKELENRIHPDVILIDSRAGIDEIASSCVMDLGANLVLLFSIDGSQTWSGYRILFNHWQRSGVIEKIRTRVQIVSALTLDVDTIAYLERFRDNAYDLFLNTQYDEVPAGDMVGKSWSFEATDILAPHYPWAVKWHRSFAGIQSLHGRLQEIDADEVNAVFGPLTIGIAQNLGLESPDV